MNNSQELIKELIIKRKQLKMSRNKLSKKIGVYHSSIDRIEKDEMNPTLNIFIAMANTLGYDLVLQKLDKQPEDTLIKVRRKDNNM